MTAASRTHLPRPGAAAWTPEHAEGATAFALHVSELLDAAGVEPAPTGSGDAVEAVCWRLRALPRQTAHPDGLVPLDPGAWSPGVLE